MKLIQKITLALGLLMAGSASFAQTDRDRASTSSQGLLGQRYVEASFGLADINGISDHLYAVGASINQPVIASLLDVSAGYAYGWTRGIARGHANMIGADATAYMPFRGVTPFVTLGLGHRWTRFASFRDESMFWGAEVGFEIPVGRVTLTPNVSYSDDFEGGDSKDFAYEIEANYWFSPAAAVYGAVGRIETHRSSLDMWSYEAGLRWRF